LRRIWRIVDDDDVEQVRAKTILRIETVLRKFGDPQLSLVVRTYYNIDLDAPTRDLPLGERLKDLHDREGARFSPRTTKRLFDTFLAELVVSLGQSSPPVSAQLLRGILARERTTAPKPRSSSGDGDLPGQVFPRPNGAVDPVSPNVRRFLSSEVHGTGSSGNDWVCVFASLDRLAAYQRSRQMPWRGEHWTKTGADVVREVLRHEPPPGIVLNPGTRREAESLVLPPSLVGRLAESLWGSPVG
jgi:hypothetical protein